MSNVNNWFPTPPSEQKNILSYSLKLSKKSFDPTPFFLPTGSDFKYKINQRFLEQLNIIFSEILLRQEKVGDCFLFDQNKLQKSFILMSYRPVHLIVLNREQQLSSVSQGFQINK